MSSDEDALFVDDGPMFFTMEDTLQSTAASSTPRALQSADTFSMQETKFNMAWVKSMHQRILSQVRSDGIEACKWAFVLEKWKEFLADAPFEEVEFGCIRTILQYARLTPNAQPTFYEALRKLGKDILCINPEDDFTRRLLLNQLLTPGPNDTELYAKYFGPSEKWQDDPRSLMNHLDKLHALYGSTLCQELQKEDILGFIVPHIRSNRYHPVELAAVLKHIVRGVPETLSRHWKELAVLLEGDDESAEEHLVEAQSFILRCFENMYRARQSLEGAEKRCSAVGVILFGDVYSNSEHGEMQRSLLDEWHDSNLEKSQNPELLERSQNILERCTLKQIGHLIDSERVQWEEWEVKLKKRKGPDFRVAKQPLFSILSPDKLSSPSLLSHVMNSIKAYAEKKKNLRELAEKSSRTACVTQAMLDSVSDSPSPLIKAPRGGRHIAVFGYTLNHDGKGVPEAAEQSVIVRSVALTRKYCGDDASASEDLDARVFEIGISLSGSYLMVSPRDTDELHDMLRTSGLGLSKEDRVQFFQFVPQGQHSPRSKAIDEILQPTVDGKNGYTHALLTIPDTPGRHTAAAYSEIADAGGRFLIDMRRVGSCKTEGMRYHPLAVEAAASVAVSEDGKARAFRRLAVLLPPSIHNEMPNGFALGRLGSECERGAGFQESAEIIAEVLSLVAIDKSKMDDSSDSAKYRALIKRNLEGNPLLLYYTSIDLLNTTDLTFARIIAEHWEEKLGLGKKNFAANLTKDEIESRKLVLSLITSGVPRGSSSNVEPSHRATIASAAHNIRQSLSSSDSPVPFSCASVVAGKRIALATETHLRHLPNIIQRETHFAQEDLFVEESNFESVLLRLKRASPSSLTFIFVYITGRISADQINQFVSVPASAIKLIFRYSQSLVTLLDLTPSIRDVIHRPESINSALTDKMRPVSYSETSAVGAVVTYNTRMLSQTPGLICEAGRYWDDKYPENFVGEAVNWMSNLADWVERPVADDAEADEFLRILVTSDHVMTSRYILENFATIDPRLIVRVVDAGDRSKFDELKSIVDCKSSTTFSFSNVKSITSRAKQDDGSEVQSGSQRTLEVFVLCRTSFLPHSRLEILVSRCCSRRAKLILLASEPSSVISRFRVFKDPTSPPIWVRVSTVTQRQFNWLDNSRSHLAFTGLQLIFSHDSVITDDHFKSVEKFLESQDIEVLGFLDHIEGIPTDRAQRSSMMVALASNDDFLKSSDDLIATKKCSFGEVIGMHINRYLRFPSCRNNVVISFSDFCRQPRARFLSQIHRVEAYMCYIFSKTASDRRISAKGCLGWPLGFPIGRCFTGLGKNTHTSTNPGNILSAIFEKEASLSEIGKIVLPPAQYLDPGRGDIVTHTQEITERRAIVGAELHWEEMFVKWDSGPEIIDDVLDHILIYSPCRISVLLSMTPPQIANLNLSTKALQAIAHDFENCEESLRHLPSEEYRILRTRTAAVSWLLLTKGAGCRQFSEKNFSEDQRLLLDSGIYIEPSTDHDDGATENVDRLLFHAASAMITLDTPETLTNQHAVRDFLLSNSNDKVVGKILDNPDIRLGRALINACVARETLNSIIARKCGMGIFDRLGNVLKWVKEPKTANIENMRKDMAVFAPRLTPRAIACIIMSANPPYDLDKARAGILDPCVGHAEQLFGHEAAKSYLDDVLKPICEDRGLAVELFSVLTKPASNGQLEFPVPDLKDVSPAWNAMYVAMKDPANTEKLFQTVLLHNFVLPFEVSDRLCEMYINYFCVDCRDIARDLELHMSLLPSDLSRDAIYKFLTSRSDESLVCNSSTLALVWFTWWSKPWLSFPLRYLPTRETWSVFQRVAQKITISEEKALQGLSTMARFAVAPHTLPASTANALKFAMVDDKPIVSSEKYVLAQFQSTTYPVYGFRTHRRYLPRECIEVLIKEMQTRKLPGLPGDSKEQLKRLFPVTDSGVSTDIVQRNLNILVHIHKSPQSVESKKTQEMRAQIFLPTIAWFFAAGIDLKDLKSMMQKEDEMQFANNYSEMVSTWRKPDFPKALVYCPLPVYVDVRFVCGKPGTLFQCNPESTSITVQWLAMLGLQYDLNNYNAPEQFYQHAVDRASGRHVDQDLPKQIVFDTMKRIAEAIVQKHSHVRLNKSATGNYHVVFVLDDSGSMAGQPWTNLVAAVQDFLNVRLLAGAEDKISLITFNSTASKICEQMPIQTCHQDLSKLLVLRGGGTSFSHALATAHQILTEARSDSKYLPVLIFMSDGGSNDGEKEMQDIARDFAPKIIVRTFAFGSGADVSKLETLAVLGKGKFSIAIDGEAIRTRFAEVAHDLACDPQKRGSSEDSTAATKAHLNAEACSAVIDSCVPLADFFAQLRTGSQAFAKCAFEGLGSGLRGSLTDLQVCFADALYMLIGVTPLNSGIEVMHMLEVWRKEQLTIGSSVIMEIDYMARNIYEKSGLGDLARKLTAQIQGTNPKLRRVPYVRNPANTPLSSVVSEPGSERELNIYSFIEIPLIACPGRITSEPQLNSGKQRASPDRPTRVANFDHVKNPSSESSALEPTQTDFTPTILFRSAISEERGSASIQNKSYYTRRTCRGFAMNPRTVSARDLVHVDTGPMNDCYSGYSVIRIVPGLHPVLRSPGDSQNIPVSQQKSLGRSRDSFDREDHPVGGPPSKIEAIFSNNGGTWANLNQLPTGSTIMGKGFYLRKSREGWVFLIGATTSTAVHRPPYVLWVILDTLKLAALDFAEAVINTLRAVLCLAFDPADSDMCAEDSKFPAMLDKIRSWHSAHTRRNNDSDSKNYVEYLKRERVVCAHLLQVMNTVRDDHRGAAMKDTFQEDELERKLKVRVQSTRKASKQIIDCLSQFIGIRDWVPRSQLIFTLELVLANLQNIIPSEQELPVSSLTGGSDPFFRDDTGDEELQAQEAFTSLDQSSTETSSMIVGTTFPKNKLIAAHEHITQYKFHTQSLQIIRSIEKRKAIKNQLDWTRRFCDSDDEDEDAGLQQVQDHNSKVEDDYVISNAHREREIAPPKSNDLRYEDDDFDMPGLLGSCSNLSTSPIFPGEWGYGHRIFSQFCVPSVYGESVPLYFVQIDVRRLKIAYSDADGLPIAYLFHKRLLDKSLKEFRYEKSKTTSSVYQSTGDRKIKVDEENDSEEENDCRSSSDMDRDVSQESQIVDNVEISLEDSMLAYRKELLCWLTDLVRSPLPNSAKDWFLDKLEHGPTTRCVPSLSIKESEEDLGGDLNLVVIAHCIATALPAPNECRQIFRTAFHIPKGFLPFCKRKNDLYGVHIVRGGTLQELQDHGAVVEVCSLGYDALTRSKDNASMYLAIIGHFSTFTWLVYVTGLDHIDDALLKWLAEYTKAHPWRFVYLENTQTSWNFSENRDRCIYDRAPPPVERNIRTENDLKNPDVGLLRPTHLQPYPRVEQHLEKLNISQHKLRSDNEWKMISSFTRSFFRNSSGTSCALDSNADEEWSVGLSEYNADYRETMKDIFKEKEPCVVLLCSPPGAGKSYFSNELAEMLKRMHSIGRAFIDGSDDRLVDMALTEILNVELPDPTKYHFLIVDEFHMLKEHHKQDLFDWLEEHARRLHVLLIANRKDANDEKLLDNLKRKSSGIGLNAERIRHFSTRLGNILLDEVMQKMKIKKREQIRRWMHCCRCLFGGEAVSLRGISALEEKLKAIEQRTGSEEELINLLLDKVPTVSESTAREFVTAFLASCEVAPGNSPITAVANKIKGPVSLMVQAALLTESDDLVGMDFTDFVSFGLDRAYDAPPSLRIAAWCCHLRFHMRHEKDRIASMDVPTSVFQFSFVDQCGFPLQLEDTSFANLSEGLAFSWGGDYSRIEDIIDAVKHGHSVDWSDVHERCWKCEPVQDSRLLVELLSVCTSPAKVLSALTKDNLCSLLKKSSPGDSLNIAHDVLRYQTHASSAKADKFMSPYRTAIWMVICYNKSLSEPRDLLICMGDSGTEPNEKDVLDWRENELVDALIWASTHMQDMVTCRGDDDPRIRTDFVRSTLLYLSLRLMANNDNARVPRLWGGMFSSILGVPKKSKGRGRESDILVYVAIHAEDINSRWCNPLPHLWAICHGKGTAAQVAAVWSTYPELFFVRDDRSPIHPRLAGGILCVSGVIPSDLQLALLTRGGAVDLSLVGDRCEHAVSLVLGAVESLVKDGGKGIQLADGHFRDLVLREARKFQEEDEGTG